MSRNLSIEIDSNMFPALTELLSPIPRSKKPARVFVFKIGCLLLLLLISAFFLWTIGSIIYDYRAVAQSKQEIVSHRMQTNAHSQWNCGNCKQDATAVSVFQCHQCVRHMPNSKNERDLELYRLSEHFSKSTPFASYLHCHDPNSLCHRAVWKFISITSNHVHDLLLGGSVLLWLFLVWWCVWKVALPSYVEYCDVKERNKQRAMAHNAVRRLSQNPGYLSVPQSLTRRHVGASQELDDRRFV